MLNGSWIGCRRKHDVADDGLVDGSRRTSDEPPYPAIVGPTVSGSF